MIPEDTVQVLQVVWRLDTMMVFVAHGRENNISWRLHHLVRIWRCAVDC